VAAMITQGMPLSISVHSTPSITSTTLPEGSRLPHIDPAMFWNIKGTAAWLPGTPSIRAAPR